MSRLRGFLVAVALLVVAACGGEDPAPPPLLPRVAFADASAVVVRASDGTTKRVAQLPGGWQAESLTWSGDGKELAWVATNPRDYSQGRIYRAAASGNPVRHWDCTLFCCLVAFLGSDLVGEGALRGAQIYPASGGEPEYFDPEGLPGGVDLLGGRNSRSLLAGAPAGDALYFQTIRSRDERTTIYRVGADRKAVELPAPIVTGFPLNGTVSPDGSKLAFTVEGTAPGCNATESVIAIDVSSVGASRLVPPSSTAAMFVAGLWFDDDGEVFAAYVPGPVTCAAGTAEQPDTPTRATTATVYERDGTTWKSTGRSARDGAELGGGRRLELTGPVTVSPSRIQQSPGGTLQLAGDGDPEVISTNVTAFAVAPG